MSFVIGPEFQSLLSLKAEMEDHLLSLGYIPKKREPELAQWMGIHSYYQLGQSCRRLILDLRSPDPFLQLENYSRSDRTWSVVGSPVELSLYTKTSYVFESRFIGTVASIYRLVARKLNQLNQKQKEQQALPKDDEGPAYFFLKMSKDLSDADHKKDEPPVIADGWDYHFIAPLGGESLQTLYAFHPSGISTLKIMPSYDGDCILTFTLSDLRAESSYVRHRTTGSTFLGPDYGGDQSLFHLPSVEPRPGDPDYERPLMRRLKKWNPFLLGS